MTELIASPGAGSPLALTEILRAADAALAVIPSPVALTAGPPGREPGPSTLIGACVRARFTGPISGTLLIAVDDALTHPLATSPLGPLSPAKALQPALEAAALALGPVTLGPAEMCDPPAGIEELIRSGGALVPLKFGHTVHAMVGLNIEAVAPPRAERVSGPAFAGGLDLLRGVEMEVSAELGRARMSLDDLLNLGDGAVIELDRAAGAPADLLVNGRLIARGEVVVVDENFGLRITEIITDVPNR